MDWGGYLMGVAFAASGLGFLFRARAIRNWLITLYADPRITRHLRIPGYVL